MEIYEKQWGEADDPSGAKIWATFLEDGSLTLGCVDYGETVRAFKGDGDYEYVLTVPAESV